MSSFAVYSKYHLFPSEMFYIKQPVLFVFADSHWTTDELHPDNSRKK